ncbi:MAG: hypothetical protein PUB84_00585 [Bacteroidales bacterium]|nr:hypothetical protein [Bacteroidales bacterium]MDD6555115.1 hypothetical protein [Bacteroidales bacterium]MDD6774918.1 hypothetical protein [Bacteroidales bacterium]
MKKTYIKPSLEVVELMGSNEVLTRTSLGVYEEAGNEFLSNKRDNQDQKPSSGSWNSSLWGNME